MGVTLQAENVWKKPICRTWQLRAKVGGGRQWPADRVCACGYDRSHRVRLAFVWLFATACTTSWTVGVSPTLQTDGAIGVEVGVGGAIGIGSTTFAQRLGAEARGGVDSATASAGIALTIDAVRWGPRLESRLGLRSGVSSDADGRGHAEIGGAAAVLRRLPGGTPSDRRDLGGELRVIVVSRDGDDPVVRFGLGVVLEGNKMHRLRLFDVKQ